MKHRDLVRHLEEHGCEFLREGGSHTIYVNRQVQAVSAVPRHLEINNILARKICRDLSVPEPTHSYMICEEAPCRNPNSANYFRPKVTSSACVGL